MLPNMEVLPDVEVLKRLKEALMAAELLLDVELLKRLKAALAPTAGLWAVWNSTRMCPDPTAIDVLGGFASFGSSIIFLCFHRSMTCSCEIPFLLVGSLSGRSIS